MKKIIKKVFKILYYIILTIILLCVSSIIYNKIKYPESPYTVFKYQIYVDMTNSMMPKLNVNDVIIVKKCDKKDIQIGDIITFREGSVTVTHRVIDIITDNGEEYFITKGDNNNTKDDRPVPFSDVEGIYIFDIPLLGFLITNKIFLVLVILLLLIITYFPCKKLRQNKESKEERECFSDNNIIEGENVSNDT